MICAICKQECLSLGQHLKSHSISPKAYYDEYLRKENEGICEAKNCNNETHFCNLNKGYRRFCCKRCSTNDEAVIKKGKQTDIERYGTYLKINPDKRETTIIKKYGSQTNCSKLAKIKENETRLRKYGTINPNCNKSDDELKEIQNKREETYFAKTGFRFAGQNPLAISKMKRTKLKRYGDENYNNMEKNLRKCYDFISYKNGEFTCVCEKCKQVKLLPSIVFKVRHNHPVCLDCEAFIPRNSFNSIVSGGEKDIVSFIRSISSVVVMENDRTVLKPKELDIYIPEKKLAIEFDGLYWHNETRKKTNYHLEKTKMCEANGIQLIHIFEDEWMYKQSIVKSRLQSLIGLSERIYARKTICKEISDTDARIFLDMNHIQGTCVSKYRYGLFYNDELVAVMTFGESRFKKGEFELLRFANKLSVNVIGGAGKLFKHFLNEHPEIVNVISFADRRWSKGNLYEKLGFSLTAVTPPNYYYILSDGRHNRIEFQKHKLVAAGADTNKSEHEIMLEREIYRIYDCGNLKYTYRR